MVRSESEDSDSEPEDDEGEEVSVKIETGDEDPLEALSTTTKAFLNSIGITTAAAFLSQRSSDIAPQFVKWRADEEMTALRGSGPVASVSAWKTTVRNRAKEIGL